MHNQEYDAFMSSWAVFTSSENSKNVQYYYYCYYYATENDGKCHFVPQTYQLINWLNIVFSSKLYQSSSLIVHIMCMHTHTHIHIHIHIHIGRPCFMGIFNRRNDFYSVQTVNCISYH